RRNKIRRTRSAGRDADAGLTSRTRVTFRRVSRTLLMSTQHVAQTIAILPHRVVERHDRAAGNAEHDLDVLAHESFAHHLGAGAVAGGGRRDAGGGVCHPFTPAFGLYSSRVE